MEADPFLKEDIFHHYQPIYNIQDWEVLGYEGLFRTKNKLNPKESFIKAKNAKKLYELDSHSIHKASTTFKEAGYIKDNKKLFLNVFPSTITNQNFLPFINKIIVNNGFASQQIILEIIEDEEINFTQMRGKLEKLNEFGLQTAIDDFGQGFTSLRSVIELQTDYIKLDKYFVQDIKNSKHKLTMIERLVDYCAEMDSKLIIEGVEDEESLNILINVGVKYAQGFILGKPSLLTK